MLKTYPIPKIALNLILNLLLLFAFPLTKTFAEPDTYGAFELRLECPQKTFNVGEELGILIVISHTYPATLPGTFVVELYRKGLKEWEYLINVDTLRPGDNEFTLKKFGVPAFNQEPSSAGEWRIRVYPLRDKEKAQEISLTILEGTAEHLKDRTTDFMSIMQAVDFYMDLVQQVKKRGHVNLGEKLEHAAVKYSAIKNPGGLAGYLKSLDLSAYPDDIRRPLRRFIVTLERFAQLNINDFPIHAGDRYILLHDAERQGMANLKAPFHESFNCTLPKDTVLVVTRDNRTSRALAFHLAPEDYEWKETKLVPKELRDNPEYSGYYFTFTIDEIGMVIKKVE